jgi:hypothetical protein
MNFKLNKQNNLITLLNFITRFIPKRIQFLILYILIFKSLNLTNYYVKLKVEIYNFQL